MKSEPDFRPSWLKSGQGLVPDSIPIAEVRPKPFPLPGPREANIFNAPSSEQNPSVQTSRRPGHDPHLPSRRFQPDPPPIDYEPETPPAPPSDGCPNITLTLTATVSGLVVCDEVCFSATEADPSFKLTDISAANGLHSMTWSIIDWMSEDFTVDITKYEGAVCTGDDSPSSSLARLRSQCIGGLLRSSIEVDGIPGAVYSCTLFLSEGTGAALGDPSANAYTVCGDIAGSGAIEGTITIET